MSKSKVVPATSKQVREWFAAHPNKVPKGAEVSVQVSCKGRLAQSAIEAFNKAAKSHGMQYVEGNRKTVPVTFKARNHRMVTRHLPVAEIRALAGKPESRGPLGKAALVAAGEALAAG